MGASASTSSVVTEQQRGDECICKPDQELEGTKRKRRSSMNVEANKTDEIVGQFEGLSISPGTGDGVLLGDGDKSQDASIPTTDLPKNVLYYGWFFSPAVTVVIQEIADAYLKECLKVPQFQRFLNDACTTNGGKDIEGYYKYPRRAKAKSQEDFQHHITAKFLGREFNEIYAKFAQQYVGKKFFLHLVGLFFTAKTFGIRVELTEGQKTLFDERDGGSPVESLASSGSRYFLRLKDRVDEGQADKASATLLDSELRSGFRKTKNPKCQSSLHSKFSESDGVSLAPLPRIYYPFQSRAHITIGCGPRVSPVQTGLDLVDINDLEQRSKSRGSSVVHQDFSLDGGTLRQFGRFGDAFVIYPCHKLVVEAMFNYFI